MRVLARREVISEREARLVVTTPPAAKQRRTPAPDPAPAPVPAAAPAAEATRTVVTGDRVKARIAARRKAAAAAARRRRHILVALVLVGSGVGAAAALGRLPLWAAAIPVVTMLAFLVLARVTVRRERARWDAELVRLKVAASTSPIGSAAGADSVASDSVASDSAAPHAAAPEVLGTVAVSADQIAARAHNEQGLAVVSGLDDTSSFPMGLLDDVAPTTDAGSLWDPLPVTLPTYVTKPRADRSVRTIDLQAPGVSSSGHDAASSALVADAATSLPPDDLPQRAVGS